MLKVNTMLYWKHKWKELGISTSMQSPIFPKGCIVYMVNKNSTSISQFTVSLGNLLSTIAI